MSEQRQQPKLYQFAFRAASQKTKARTEVRVKWELTQDWGTRASPAFGFGGGEARSQNPKIFSNHEFFRGPKFRVGGDRLLPLPK